MNKRPALLALLTFLLVAPVRGQNSEVARNTLSGLEGVAIFVEPPAENLSDRGITDFVFAVQIERRLQEAGIPVVPLESEDQPPGLPLLYLNVVALVDDELNNVTASMRLELTQMVRLDRDRDGPAVPATTWSTGGVAHYGKNWREAIVADAVSYTDMFIEAFATADLHQGDRP